MEEIWHDCFVFIIGGVVWSFEFYFVVESVIFGNAKGQVFDS
jgi:hypothetical protein